MTTTARPRLRLLSPGQMEAVHEASLHVLAESGLRVDSERARRIFRRGGARVRNDRVYPARELVDWAIEQAPSTVDVFDRRGEKAFRIGGDATRFGTGVTNLWYQDPLTDALAPFSREHMARGVRLSEALPSFDVISTLGVLRDLSPGVADLYAVLEMVANATKPLVLLVSDEKLFVPALDLLETLRGELGSAPFAIPYLNPITPLVLNEGTTDKLLEPSGEGSPSSIPITAWRG